MAYIMGDNLITAKIYQNSNNLQFYIMPQKRLLSKEILDILNNPDIIGLKLKIDKVLYVMPEIPLKPKKPKGNGRGNYKREKNKKCIDCGALICRAERCKPCRSAKWYKDNPGKSRIRAKIYYYANTEKCLIRSGNYYKENTVDCIKSTRRAQAKRKAEIKEYNRVYGIKRRKKEKEAKKK